MTTSHRKSRRANNNGVNPYLQKTGRYPPEKQRPPVAGLDETIFTDLIFGTGVA